MKRFFLFEDPLNQIKIFLFLNYGVMLSNVYIVNCVGYSNNERNENNGFSYNLILKNIPYHIKGGLKRTPIMPAHPPTYLYRE